MLCNRIQERINYCMCSSVTMSTLKLNGRLMIEIVIITPNGCFGSTLAQLCRRGRYRIPLASTLVAPTGTHLPFGSMVSLPVFQDH
jgi:hypothetical protein